MASLRGRSFSSVQSKVKRTTVPGNPGTFISDVRMTDDGIDWCHYLMSLSFVVKYSSLFRNRVHKSQKPK